MQMQQLMISVVNSRYTYYKHMPQSLYIDHASACKSIEKHSSAKLQDSEFESGPYLS